MVDRYTTNAARLLDPFCGSGAVLVSAQRKGIPVSGIDLNPLAALFSEVKLNGFSPAAATHLCRTLLREARKMRHPLSVQWDAKHYWFTPLTLAKFESLRSACLDLDLAGSTQGTAVILALALSILLCSKADQRSPKPFISRQAKELRGGRHYDPFKVVPAVLGELSAIYGTPQVQTDRHITLADVVCDKTVGERIGKHSHVITSPPYINAQDYFRNFKLELYLLEGVLPFRVTTLKERFIGTDRGNLLAGIPKEHIQCQRDQVPQLAVLASRHPRSEAIVHRYLFDMGRAFDNIKECMNGNGTLVLVCGDNLIAGQRIRTWQVLSEMLRLRGFDLFDSFTDQIQDRLLAPKRCGHKGLIKEEVIQAFRLSIPKRKPRSYRALHSATGGTCLGYASHLQ